MNPHDPLARVLFLLIRDDLPPGQVERAIERARLVQKHVPDSGIGRLASELADKITALPEYRIVD